MNYRQQIRGYGGEFFGPLWVVGIFIAFMTGLLLDVVAHVGAAIWVPLMIGVVAIPPVVTMMICWSRRDEPLEK